MYYKVGDILECPVDKDIIEITEINVKDSKGDNCYRYEIISDENETLSDSGESAELWKVDSCHDWGYVILKGYNTPLWKVLNGV